MDAFYASIEQRDNPELVGKPVIIGGKVGRGVVSTASYEARKYGVRSAMPISEAVRRCPDGIYIPPNIPKYRAVSEQIMNIFHRYTPDVEAISLDEAFVDVTGSQKLFGSAEQIGRAIKQSIYEELQLTASVGLAYNKFLAKLASDLDKPDGFYIVMPEDLQEKIWPLSIRRMMGVGHKTADMLERMGVKTIGQLAVMDSGLLEHIFGKAGVQMHELANGIDARMVESVREAKSFGRETTFPTDISDQYTLETVLFTLADDVCHSLRSHHVKGRTVSIKIRYPDFKSITRAITLEQYTSSFEPVYNTVKQLMEKHYTDGTPVRLIGVTVSNLKQETEIIEQQDLFADQKTVKKVDALNKVLDNLNDKYGSEIVHRARKINQKTGTFSEESRL
ncbi:MAG: DNA polymerase IV [Peptococcaceae bacterium]|nr:DNA polymerase IV [Peptococcaceae bacterium]MBO5139833.1 DNA polymerase IV [Peptococcaceae bacterium]